MKKGNKTLIAVVGSILAVLVLIAIFFISNYNSLVDLQANVKQYQSDIQADLQRRADLIPNLVNTVKGYAKHEEEIFTAIADARARMMEADSFKEEVDANNQLNSALGRLFAITENYPDLKANENFLGLQKQLEGTENRINVSRKKYNEQAKSYNTKIKRFPTNIVASMFSFEQEPYFEAEEGSQQNPNVSFD